MVHVLAQDDPNLWTNPGCWICAGISVLILWAIGAAMGPGKCGICGVELKRSKYRAKVDGKRYTVCPNCASRLKRIQSKTAMDRLLARKRK